MEEVQSMNLPVVLRVSSVVCGLGTIFTGLFSLLTSFHDFPAALIINAYLMLFAGLIVLAELRLRTLLTGFTFLQTYLGRGAFYIFVGTICFVYPSVGNVIMGSVLIPTAWCTCCSSFRSTRS